MDRDQQHLTVRFRAMGCDARIVAPRNRLDAASLARSVVDSWDRRFSRFRPDSELATINRAAGTPVPATALMRRVIGESLDAARATDGLFDPLLGGRMVELGYDRTFDALPPARVAVRLGTWRPAWGQIRIDELKGTVEIPAGYQLDLGGIVKGMAADAAVAAMVERNVPFAAVSLGGDMAVHGQLPGRESWPIAIEGAGMTILLPSGGLATSSVRTRRWRVGDDERHHLLDPRSGLPAAGQLVQASVAAESCGKAEVAAKVAVLLSTAEAIGFLEQRKLAGLLVTSTDARVPVGHWQ